MEFDENRYKHDVPYPSRDGAKVAIKALDDVPLTVAERSAQAGMLKAGAEAAYRDALEKYRAAESKTMDRFHADAEAEYSFDQLSGEVKGKIHSMVWERHHSEGLSSVWYGYSDIAEIAVAAFEAGKAAKRLPQPMKGEG